MTSHSADLSLVVKGLNDRLDRLERASRITNLGANGGDVSSTGTPPLDTLGDVAGGPRCDVHVPPSGRVFVLAQCTSSITLPGDGITSGATCTMSVFLSGANSSTTLTPVSRSITREDESWDQSDRTQLVFARLLAGLTPGLTTFTVKYSYSSNEPLGAVVTVRERSILVVPT